MSAVSLAARSFARVPASLQADVTFTRTTPGAIDPVTDTAASSTTSTAAGRFLIAPATPGAVSGIAVDALDALRAGEQIRTRGRILIGTIAAGSSFTPEAGDTATFASLVWQVLGTQDRGGLLRVAVMR